MNLGLISRSTHSSQIVPEIMSSFFARIFTQKLVHNKTHFRLFSKTGAPPAGAQELVPALLGVGDPLLHLPHAQHRPGLWRHLLRRLPRHRVPRRHDQRHPRPDAEGGVRQAGGGEAHPAAGVCKFWRSGNLLFS